MSKSVTTITAVQNAVTGLHTIVTVGKTAVEFPLGRVPTEFKVGQPFTVAAVRKAAEQARAEVAATKVTKLAKGIDAKNSPHSAKAVADSRAKAKPTKAESKAKPAAKPTKAKAEPKAKPSDDNRKLTILNKDFSFGREGTKRAEAWAKAKKAKTVADYVAAGGPVKYLSRWQTAKAIALA